MVWSVSFLVQAPTDFAGNVAITKAGITKLAGPPPFDFAKIASDKKIEDEAILELLSISLKTEGKGASKKKKKKSVKKDEE